MTKAEETLEKNKKGIFLNWKNLNSYTKTLTDKEFYMCGTGAGNVHVVIIKDNKLVVQEFKFYWFRGSNNSTTFQKLLEFINNN